jgi:acetyl esterase/lipase
MKALARRALEVLVLLLLLGACVSAPKAPPTATGAGLAQETRPGSLLGWSELGTLAASRVRGLFFLLAPGILSTQLGTQNLRAVGFPEWRKRRAGALRDVRKVRIAFAARLPEGGLERQSGLLLFPATGEGLRLGWIVYMRGTELLRESVPSRNRGNELPFIETLASLGYAVWAPDYAGMGDGTGVQEYCVPESLADSGLDGLAAARSWLAAAGQGETGRLAIMGYSEGGLGAMACLAALASGRLEAPGLELAAVYPLSAPLNLQLGYPSSGAGPLLLNRPDYLIFLALGWARAYPSQVRIEEILSPRTIRELVPLFDGTRSDQELHAAVCRVVGKKRGCVVDGDIFAPGFLERVRAAPESVPYCRAQTAERLDRFTPPEGLHVLLAASPTDEVVSFANSAGEVAWAMEKAPGSGLSLLVLASPDHLRGAVEALLYSIVDFDTREGPR